MKYLLAGLAVLVISCPACSDDVWVGKRFKHGGSQCDRGGRFDAARPPPPIAAGKEMPIKDIPPPSVESQGRLFQQKNIQVLEHSKISLEVCRGCNCPKHAFGLYFRINARDLQEAENIGYHKVEGPGLFIPK